jgi:hypothetical protein
MPQTKEPGSEGQPSEINVIGGAEAEAFARQEAMGWATMRRTTADKFLHWIGYQPPGNPAGTALLDQITRKLEEADMLDEAGGLLQSSEATLRHNPARDIYFIGLNPGGNAGVNYSVLDKGQTIYESLALARLGVCGWDQDWSRDDASYLAGGSPLQRRFKYIAKFLGLPYAEILATNHIFARSRSFKALTNISEQLAACLPIHQMMIDAVRPKRLWIMGNVSHASDVIRLHEVEWRDARNKNWMIGHGKVDFCGRRMMLCHTPHLSYWDATATDKQELLAFAFGVPPAPNDLRERVGASQGATLDSVGSR